MLRPGIEAARSSCPPTLWFAYLLRTDVRLGLNPFYSGCMDFLLPDECVRFSMVPVGDGYPFGDGLCWAEPDIEDAAERMRFQARTA